MKWEKIKNAVASEVAGAVQQGRHAQEEILADLVASDFDVLRQLSEKDKWHGPIREAYANQVYKRIKNWDIRAVNRLRDLFQNAFPRSLQKGSLLAELDDDGDWAVVLKASSI
jgi:hypothetical protein